MKKTIHTKLSDFLVEKTTNFNDNFINWFNNSMVVDSRNNPLVVYHGTTVKFKKFNKSKQVFGHHGKGFYFADKNYAEGYYGNDYITCYLRAEKIFDLYKEYTVDEIKEIFKDDYHLVEDLVNEELEYNDTLGGYLFYVTAGNDRLIKSGYDGIKQDYVYVVFEPNQIKSTDNDGSWDLSDENINS
jgi:hypothetical protein